ncbi:hypothetical protein BUALT_Bualt18G0101400 [Buddleja alternifolia]|uniref:Uncharacterized protein n=1 Tax=Buddleja alternifolia TaxID=168488 RepID=A0AAV6W9M5_9LAMI|nr:hypothetical protein BUALT_Bualt18G0101400 [Buddleja alternifolia]
MDEHLKNLFSRFQEQFGSGPGLGPGSGTCLTKIHNISPNFIKSLYKAAASLYRSDPWRRLRPRHLLGVKVGKDFDWYGRKQPFPCIQFVGGDGGDVAIHMFRSEDDAKRMTSPRETVRAPNVELLRVTYEIESQMFRSHKKMIQSLSLEVSGEDRYPVVDVARCSSSSSGEVRFRSPTIEELRYVYGVLRGVCLLHPLLEQDFGSGRRYDRVALFKPFIETVDVQWGVEMAKGNDLVAVTVSYPPNRGYEGMIGSGGSTPVEYPEPGKEEI